MPDTAVSYLGGFDVHLLAQQEEAEGLHNQTPALKTLTMAYSTFSQVLQGMLSVCASILYDDNSVVS